MVVLLSEKIGVSGEKEFNFFYRCNTKVPFLHDSFDDSEA